MTSQEVDCQAAKTQMRDLQHQNKELANKVVVLRHVICERLAYLEEIAGEGQRSSVSSLAGRSSGRSKMI